MGDVAPSFVNTPLRRRTYKQFPRMWTRNPECVRWCKANECGKEIIFVREREMSHTHRFDDIRSILKCAPSIRIADHLSRIHAVV